MASFFEGTANSELWTPCRFTLEVTEDIIYAGADKLSIVLTNGVAPPANIYIDDITVTENSGIDI